jgi:hypothetical protein
MNCPRFLLTASATAALFSVSAFAAEIVPVDHFGGIGLHGGGHVTVRYGAQQRVTILKGSTQFTRIVVEHGGSLNIDACNERCPDRYDLDIEIVSPDVGALAVEGGGSITAAGDFPDKEHFDVAVNGGGHIDARQIRAQTIGAAVNGGGHIEVAANGALTAAVSGGGHIVYSGNPKISQAVSGGGSIEHADK